MWFYQRLNSILLENSQYKLQGQRSNNFFAEKAFHVSTVTNVVHINYCEQQSMKEVYLQSSCAYAVGLLQPLLERSGLPAGRDQQTMHALDRQMHRKL